MTDTDFKKIAKLVTDQVRDLKDVVELTKRKVDNIQIFQSASSDNVRLVKEQQSLINEKLDKTGKKVDALLNNASKLTDDIKGLKKDVKEIQENVDAARGDIELLHMDVKGIKEKESLFHLRNKREIDEIKTHLGMPLIPDIPEA